MKIHIFAFPTTVHMNKIRYTTWMTAAFYLWLVALYILTALPGNPGPEKFSDSPIRWDYLEHFFLFMLIPVLLILSGGAGMKLKSTRTVVFLIAAGIFYAVAAEVQQIWVPGRAYNPVDLTLNLSGMLTGIPAGRFFRRWFGQKQAKKTA